VRETIDFGIDLGVTRARIAVLKGTETYVFRNNEGEEYTPSAVWIDKQGRIFVGRLAKERLESDSENAFSEFKLQMGTSQIYRFATSRRQMRPEELSAEVIKSLRGDVQQRTGEEVMAAAISVPAAFELPQCDATNRAARLAGLSFSPLIQEPAAAALAYGFQNQSDRVYWMVYDFGGGTFDVAIIQVRDGQIQTANHNGDNHLGGKLIDWEIVERLFVPALKKEYVLTDFKRGNPKWTAAFAKLKLHAEEAKIQLSRDTATDILIDPLCQDDKGNWVRFDYELKRSEFVPLIEPFIERSVNLCQKTLEEKRLSPGDIEKIILIGEATLTPIFREILAAKLRIPLEFSIDPFTVIARGTAIFAGTQPMPKDIVKKQYKAPDMRYELLYENRGIGKYYNDPKNLASEFQNKKVYLENLRRRAQQLGAVQADELFRRIQQGGMFYDIGVLLMAVQAEPDAADKCEKRLRDLQTAIDEAEDAVEFFALVSKADKEIEDAREIVKDYGKEDDRSNFESLEKEIRETIGSRDIDLLRQKEDQMETLNIKVLMELDELWIEYFKFLEQHKSEMRDKSLAERLFIQGRRAIEAGDINQLKTIVHQLVDLLERPIQPIQIWAAYRNK